MATRFSGRIGLWLLSLFLILGALRWVGVPIVCRLFSMEVKGPVRLEREWQGEVLVIPEEKLITAPVSGRITVLVQDGQWVAPGTILAEIVSSTGEIEVVYSPSGGIAALEMKEKTRRRQLADGEAVLPGDRILRIIRPNFLYLEIDPVALGKAALENSVKLQVREIYLDDSGSGRELWYSAEFISQENGGHKLRLAEFPLDWLRRETLLVRVRMEGPMGIRVPARAIVTGQGQEGIFVVGPGGPEFRSVEVLDEAGGDAVVRGLEAGEKILTRPGFLTSGEFSNRNGH
ncbi:MAG: hypothetical protein GX047_10840 [Firmicutes bacterium]|nr:hypothetical protein [Bacillota bacterium]